MPDARFTYSLDTLREMVADVLRIAREQGATDAEADVSEGYGQTVTVRKDEVETIEYNRDKGLGVSVYIGKQRGYASSSDLAPKAIRDTVAAALSIARFTAADEAAGLADPALISRSSRDLDLFHPWDLPVEQAIAMAKACEAAALPARSAHRQLRGRERLDPAVAVHRRQHRRLPRRVRELPPLHLVRGHRGRGRRDAARRLVFVAARRRRPCHAGVDRGLCRPARARAAAQPQARQAEGPRAVRGPGRERPALALRLRGERRQPLSQELVPRRQPRDAGVLADHQPARGAASPARPRERLLRRRRGGERHRATS